MRILSVLALVLSACGAPTLTLDHYVRSCQADSDCVAVGVGGGCPCVPCPNAAINVSSKQQYDDDVDALDCHGCNAGPCPKPAVICGGDNLCAIAQ